MSPSAAVCVLRHGSARRTGTRMVPNLHSACDATPSSGRCRFSAQWAYPAGAAYRHNASRLHRFCFVLAGKYFYGVLSREGNPEIRGGPEHLSSHGLENKTHGLQLPIPRAGGGCARAITMRHSGSCRKGFLRAAGGPAQSPRSGRWFGAGATGGRWGLGATPNGSRWRFLEDR